MPQRLPVANRRYSRLAVGATSDSLPSTLPLFQSHFVPLDTRGAASFFFGMDKRKVIERIREEFRIQFEKLKRASDSAREDATDAESKAESKYDTQGLEASYLAAGQAERAEDLALALQAFNAEPFPPFPPKAPIAEGALVEADFGGDIEWFLLAPSAGGMTVELDGSEITILGPGAPLREKLTGQKTGKKITQPDLKIKSVC